MTDAHNHLQDARFDSIRETVVTEMLEAGVTRCVVNGTCPDDWPKVAELAKQYPDLVIPSFGLHPWKKPADGWKEQLLYYLDAFPNSCLGECGLDRWIKDYDIDLQTEIFTAQLEIATERNLPLTIHCLKAWGPLIDVLESHELPKRGFLLHSYGGSAELIPRLTKLGAYFSFSGYFLHPKKAKVLDVFREVPSDRLLMETDAPDMLPPENIITHPLSDELNHPANLIAIMEAASKTLDTSLVNSNFETLFES
ncbi:hydrolase TatD family protein [Oceaniferula spumae]|uniref:Hydrolase TatD family protein n=1 Tax=Oceaniferula spumae TaxID=2979115 RepID=A0AAT9FSG2_9BACT